MLKILLYRSAWLAVGSAVGRLVPLGFLFWSSTFFTNQQYSSLSTIFMLSTVFTTLLVAGISNVLTQRIASSLTFRGQFKIVCTYYVALLSVVTIFAFVCFFGGGWAASKFFQGAVVKGLHLPTAVSAWAWPQVVFVVAVLNGLEKSKLAAFLVGSAGIAQGLGMIFSYLIYGADVISITWGFAVGCMSATVISICILIQISGIINQRSRKWVCIDFKLINEAKYAIIINTAASATIMPVSFLAGVQIAKTDDGTVQLAQYYFLEQLNQVLIYFPAIFGQILIPAITRKLSSASETQFTDVINYTCRLVILLFVIATLLACIGMFFSPYLLEVIQTPQLGPDAVWAFNWMIYNALLMLPMTVLGAALMGSGNIVFGSFSNLCWGACVLILTNQLAHFGNSGFQASRVAASILLIAVTISFLIFLNPRQKNKDNSL